MPVVHRNHPLYDRPLYDRPLYNRQLAAEASYPPPKPPGMKYDGGKPRWDLLLAGMPLALEEVVRVLTYGSHKYADGNWAFVENAEQRYLAAGLRHEAAYQRGEDHDPETGLHHLAHEACCLLFRLELLLRQPQPPGPDDVEEGPEDD